MSGILSIIETVGWVGFFSAVILGLASVLIWPLDLPTPKGVLTFQTVCALLIAYPYLRSVVVFLWCWAGGAR